MATKVAGSRFTWNQKILSAAYSDLLFLCRTRNHPLLACLNHLLSGRNLF
jgi:hypothetical protein